MSIQRTPRNAARDIARQMWPKRQPRRQKPKNPGEQKTRELVAERSGGLCERCGRRGESVHHRVNRSQGGPWSGSNCVHLCGDGTRGCHGWVGANPLAAAHDGFHVLPKTDPAAVPLRSIHGLVLLADDGSVEAVEL